jgi:hypothetical protein
MEMELSEETFLTDDFLRQLMNVGEVDILVGLPTYNNAKTVGSIVRTIQSGVLRGFPRERAVIINADAGSRDGTTELVTGVSIGDERRAPDLNALRTLHSITTDYSSTESSERAGAFHTILAAADLLRAKACAVMSPESENIEPDWISKLLRPILRDGFDLVTPTYRRHRFEGLLVTNLLYPMSRALYGLRIREPFSPEFGFSGRLGSRLLEQNIWDDGRQTEGVDIRLTLAAIAGQFRICQSFLGDKPHVQRRGADLVPALRQTVGNLFSALEPDFPVWSKVSASQAPPTTGPDHEVLLDPLRINRKRLREMFSSGVSELDSVFQSILSASTIAELRQVARMEKEQFHFSADLWVRVVYEFAVAYQKSVISRDHIIQALAPLFRGRAYTFMMENRDSSAEDVENSIESLCLEFERLKPYLLEMWKPRE